MSFGLDVLAFAPHPDDVEIFCGGTMIRLADLGYRTGIVDLTRGELATHGTPEVRAREAAAAAAVMGLAVRENLGLADGFLDPSPASPHLGPIVEVLRQHRPELVLVPWIEERHPDHAAAGRLLTRAVFLAGLRKYASTPPHTPRQVLYYEMRHRMEASFVVDTSAAWARKVEAIRCHASQVAPPEGSAPTLVGSPQAIRAIEIRDAFQGTRIGTDYGEPWRATATLGVADPVAFFRAAPGDRAHFFEPLR